jgi:quercetin dioxygenase-like cupin family protein
MEVLAVTAILAPASDIVTIINEPTKAYWLDTDLMEVLVTREQSGGRYDVVRGTIQPGGGPPPHRHAREDELFYVVAGEFEFIRNDEIFIAGAGTSVFLPRGSVHTFKNVGARAGTLIVVTTPSGFADFVAAAAIPASDRAAIPVVTSAALIKLAEAAEDFDIELMPTWQPKRRTAPPAFIHDLWVTGLQVRILAGNAQTNNAFAVGEITAHPGDFVPPHTHDPEDEMFYVLAGEVEFDVPGGAITATSGTFVHIPRGVFHGFRNASEADAKLLDLHTPGGFEAFFADSGTLWPDLSINPPPGAWVDVLRFICITEKHGMEVAKPG